MPRGVYPRTEARQAGRQAGSGVPVSAIDWPAMLAQLEQQRTALEQEARDIDAVIATVRRRAGAVVPAGLTLPPDRAAKPANGGANGKRASSADTDKAWVAAKKLWEKGTPVKDIAKAAGRSVGSIYAWSSEGKWKRPKPGTAAAPAGDGAEKLAGKVRCTSCDLYTEWDPCQHCGSKLKRNW